MVSATPLEEVLGSTLSLSEGMLLVNTTLARMLSKAGMRKCWSFAMWKMLKVGHCSGLPKGQG